MTVFIAGSLLYGLCELLWRGWTHWSMLLAGGLSLLLLFFMSGLPLPLWQKWLLGMAIITAVEFVTGCIVNLGLGWQVWDYSRQPLHLFGQICPLFCGIWFLLSIPAVWLCSLLRRLFQLR